MATPQQVQWEDVQSALHGQPLHQVRTAQYTVNIGDVQQGAVINFATPGRQAADRIRPRAQPPHVLPRTVSGFLDRDQEAGLVGQSLARGQVVDLHGPDGMGKTALISKTMETQLAGAYPDGMVYLTAEYETREDLLQALFDCFYETAGPVKVSENDVRRHMAGKRALVAVDDANHLKEGEAQALAQAAPQCAVVVASREQQVWQGTGVRLKGLPGPQAVELFLRQWGSVTPQGQPTVQAICQALDNAPLAIIQTASAASARGKPLAQVLQQVQPRTKRPDPVGQAFSKVTGLLTEVEQRVLGGLAAPGGATVDVEALPTITGLSPDQISLALARLLEMGLVHAHSPRCSLDGGFRAYIRHYLADETMRQRAASYYMGRADQLQAQSRDPDEGNVIGALRHFYRRKQWSEVVTIVRRIERYLATTGRWGQWRKRLHNAWHAAREIGDRTAMAWAQNQLGIIALTVGDAAAATQLFRAALGIWRILGDQTGMTIARWNLRVLLGPPPPPVKPQPPPDGGISGLTLAMGATAAFLVVVLGILFAIALQNDPTPTPIAGVTVLPLPTATTPTITPTVTPTPSITPPPPPPCRCGDGVCSREWPCNEDGYSCVPDCCLCEDGICERGVPCNEDGYNCEPDCCICGDGICETEPPCYENGGDCPIDCPCLGPPAPQPLEPHNAELVCTSDPLEVALRWQPVTDPCGVARYDIEVGENDYDYYYEGPVTSTLEIGGGLSQAVIGAQCEYDYTWRIRAVDDVGNASPWSWISEFRVLPDNEPPPIPESVGPGSVSSAYPTDEYPCTEVVLSWNPVWDGSGIMGYRVTLQRQDLSDWESVEPYYIISGTSVDVSEWTGTGFYRWRVWAIDNAGNDGDASHWLYFSCPIG